MGKHLMQDDTRNRLAAWCARQLWAIDERAFGELITAINASVSPEALFGLRERPLERRGGTAVIPVHGMITPRGDLWSLLFGGAPLDQLREQLRSAVADEDVQRIVLDVDSPGGMVQGVPEMAAEIRELLKQKPIVAFGSGMVASAAYYLAAQASEIVLTPSGEAGSIGVRAMHIDQSGLLEQLGLSVTLITAGKFKAEGNPFEPLSDEAREWFQTRIDENYRMFVDDVATGRGVTAAEVERNYGQGRVFGAERALRVGLVDRIGTLEDVLQRADRREGAGARAVEQPEVVHADDGTEPLPAFDGDHERISEPARAEEVMPRLDYARAAQDWMERAAGKRKDAR